MKKLFSTILVALVATVASYAQTIAVVSSNGVTTMHQTLADAIDKAASGSVIYLPGGGFQLSDDIKINKKLTIMGVSHRADTDNAEGATVIAGNIFFEDGSDGSALMGVYVSGTVHIGTSEKAVTNLLMRYCNVNAIEVNNSGCTGMVINQCYLRNLCNFRYANPTIENCIVHSLYSINGGTINHNIIRYNGYYGQCSYPIAYVHNSIITNNFFLEWASGAGYCDNNTVSNNCIGNGTWGDEPVQIGEGKEWKDVFKKPDLGVNINADYHLISNIGKNAGTDGKHIGIYLDDKDTGFDDHALAPIPRIISKEIPEQTDAEGKLNIKITVKSGSKSGNGSSGNGGAGGGGTSW